MSSDLAAPAVSLLHTAKYQDFLDAEVQKYGDCVEVHALPRIFHYWSNRHLVPQLASFGFTSPHEMFAKFLARNECGSRNGLLRFLSLGSGNCDLEIALARELKTRGENNFILECIDLNPAMLARGAALAKAEGVTGHIAFHQADLNTWSPGTSYDAVIANQSLHHVVNLEQLFDAVKGCLLDDGNFIVSDMIGRNGHRRWPEALPLVEDLWDILPPSYRFNRVTGLYEETYEDRDCSGESFEGVRAQDILPLLLERFHFSVFFPFGNVIDPFIDRCFGHNFDPSLSWDRSFIDFVHKRDHEEILSGRLKPTHMLAVLTKRPPRNRLFIAPLSPEYCIRSAAKSFDHRPPAARAREISQDSPHPELEIACARLAEAATVIKAQRIEIDELEKNELKRAQWGWRLDEERVQFGAWAKRLDRELEERTAWALQLRSETDRWAARVADLETQLEERTAWALSLDNEVQSRTDWALRLENSLKQQAAWNAELRCELSLQSATRAELQTILRRYRRNPLLLIGSSMRRMAARISKLFH